MSDAIMHPNRAPGRAFRHKCKYHGMGQRFDGSSSVELGTGAATLGSLAMLDPEIVLRGEPDVKVRSISMDHRGITPGSLFAVVPGTRFEPVSVIPDAIKRGAVGLVVGDARVAPEVAALVTPKDRLRPLVSRISHAIYGDPSRFMSVIGITGTNGKTTTVHVLSNALEMLGHPSGVMGTLWGKLTTPEAPDLARRLREFLDAGKEYTAMEISSIAVAMHRVDGLRLKVMGFTNLSQDHLDFHGSMERYYEAKASLFSERYTEYAVISVDDAWGRRLASECELEKSLISVKDFDHYLVRGDGLWFSLGGVDFYSPLIGLHNLKNLRTAIEILSVLGFSLKDIASVLSGIHSPPGRMQGIACAGGTILIDYAHSPEALAEALVAASVLRRDYGKLTVVFGAGGERDHGKRPIMGEVAERLADTVVLTNDNPRSEDPDAIVRDILAGFSHPDQAKIILDRRAAIEYAVGRIGPGDVVLIAGKGHETTQAFGEKLIEFNDFEIASAAASLRVSSGVKEPGDIH